MANHETDILLIRRYLNGELDARAMHRLEARAQDDPFLADAIEGYEKAGRNQQPALAGLSRRLQQRVEEKKVKRLIPFRTLAIAASILVVFTIGWLMFSRTKTATPPAIAVKPIEKTPPAQPAAKETTAIAHMIAKVHAPVIRSTTVVKPAVAPPAVEAAAAPVIAEPTADNSVIANAVTKQADTADATPLNEIVVMNYKPAKKTDVLKDANADKSYGYVAPSAALKRVTPLEQKLTSKAVGVSSSPADFKASSPGSQRFFVQGRIVDEIDGAPLPGVAIKAYGTNFGAVTDRNGRFYIPSDSIKRGFMVSRLGYNTAKVNAGSAAAGDSLKTISLAPADIPKEATLTNNAKNMSAAHPQIGWGKYDKYLNGASVSPDHQTGTVTLSFWVDKTGAISNITVVTSLSDDTDKKAINLLKKGPKWVGNTNGKPEQVELAINF